MYVCIHLCTICCSIYTGGRMALARKIGCADISKTAAILATITCFATTTPADAARGLTACILRTLDTIAGQRICLYVCMYVSMYVCLYVFIYV